MNQKKLVLHKETVKLLNDSQLSKAVGGQIPIRYNTQNIMCPTNASTCAYQCC